MDSTASSGSIVNAGLIDITGSSTFESVALNNAPSNGPGTLQVEASQTLTLIHTSIKGGIVTVAPTGLIDVTGTSSINHASLNGDGQVTVESGQKLTLDDTTVSGTTITGADATSIIQVHDTDTLTLIGGATISGGTLSLASGATLDVEGAGSPAATLDGVQVTDSDSTAYVAGTSNAGIEVGETSAAVLLVDDGTTITGGGTGTLAIGTTGTLDVEKGTSGPGATLDGVKVTDSGAIEIAVTAALSAATLLLNDGTKITGGGTGTLTIGGLGTLAVKSLTGTGTPSMPDATLDDVAVTDNNIGGGPTAA